MPNLQEVFERIKTIKKEQKEIKTAYRDALLNSKRYQDTVEDLNGLKTKKKEIEEDIRKEFINEFGKLDELKDDLATENVLLSDLALNQLMKGERVVVKDEGDNEYDPIFSVRFKKQG